MHKIHQQLPYFGATYAFFIILLVALSQVYAQLDRPGYLAGLFVVAICYLTLSKSLQFDRSPLESLNVDLKSGSWIIGLLLFAPLGWYLVATWSWGVPYGGDHLTHVSQSFRFSAFWFDSLGNPTPGTHNEPFLVWSSYLNNPLSLLTSRLAVFLLLGIGGFLTFRFYGLRICIFTLTVSLLILSLVDQSANFRWPPLGYALATVPTALALLFDWSDLGNALRLSNTLALVFWLLVLRPFFVGQAPSWKLLPFVLVLFWTPSSLFLFSSVYLESWAVILVLTGLEATIRRGLQGFPIAALLIGTAALIKEPAIISLPIAFSFSLISEELPDRSSRPKHFLTRVWLNIVAGTCAALPFLFFVIARQQLGVQIGGINPDLAVRSWRPSLDHINLELWANLSTAVEASFFPTGLLIFLIGICSSVSLLLAGRRARRIALLAIGGSFGYTVFFLVDPSSAGHLAYPRFFIWPALLFLLPLALHFDHPSTGSFVRRILQGLILIMTTSVLAISCVSLHKSSTTNSWQSNFSFYRQEPVYLPVSTLIDRANLSLDQIKQPIVINTLSPIIFRNKYSVIGRLLTFQHFTPNDCGCTQSQPHLIYTKLYRHDAHHANPFIYETGVLTKSTPDEPSVQICLEKLKESCATVAQLHQTDRLIAVLGSGALSNNRSAKD